MRRARLAAELVALVALCTPATQVVGAEQTLKTYAPYQQSSAPGRRVAEIYREIERATAGAVKIEEHWAGQLGSSANVRGALATGELHIVVGPGNEYRDKAAIGALSLMPLNFRRPADRSKVFYHTNAGTLIDAAFRKTVGIRVVGSFNYLAGQELLVRSSKRITRLDDLKGLKIGVVTPETAEVLRWAGASPTSLAFGDVYPAIERGAVDGTVAPFAAVEEWKLGDVVKQSVGPEFLFGLRMDLFQFNAKAWDRLGPAAQTKVEEVIQRAAREDDDRVTEELIPGYRAKAASAGITLATLPEEDVKRITEGAWNVQVAGILERSRKQGIGTEAELIMASVKQVSFENVVDPFDGEPKHERRGDEVVFTYMLRERADVTITVLSEGLKPVLEYTQRDRPAGENQWTWKVPKVRKGVYRVIIKGKNVYRSADFYRRITIIIE